MIGIAFAVLTTTIFNWLPAAPALLDFIIAIGGAITALSIIYVKVIKPMRAYFRKWDSALDTLRGYPAVLDPGSGAVLKAATPALSLRVERLEEALVMIASTQEKLVALEASLAERDKQGQQIIAEWSKWREAHEAEAQKREDRINDWEVWRQEQTLLTKTMVEQLQEPFPS